jgi:hypothetical protein
VQVVLRAALYRLNYKVFSFEHLFLTLFKYLFYSLSIHLLSNMCDFDAHVMVASWPSATDTAPPVIRVVATEMQAQQSIMYCCRSCEDDPRGPIEDDNVCYVMMWDEGDFTTHEIESFATQAPPASVLTLKRDAGYRVWLFECQITPPGYTAFLSCRDITEQAIADHAEMLRAYGLVNAPALAASGCDPSNTVNNCVCYTHDANGFFKQVHAL